MLPPFKIVASDVIPEGRILFVPPVTITRYVDKDGRQIAESWDFNPKAGGVIENVKVPEKEK